MSIPKEQEKLLVSTLEGYRDEILQNDNVGGFICVLIYRNGTSRSSILQANIPYEPMLGAVRLVEEEIVRCSYQEREKQQ